MARSLFCCGNKMKNIKYHAVGTFLKYHAVGTILKYHAVGTILKSMIKIAVRGKIDNSITNT